MGYPKRKINRYNALIFLIPAGKYIGIDGLSINVECQDSKLLWDPKDTKLEINNATPTEFLVTSISEAEDEHLFIDAAHLNNRGNFLIANKLKETIFENGW